MSAEFLNYVPVQDITEGEESGIIQIPQSFSQSVSVIVT